ncbi:MAG TPA: NEW3 domain-containing protein [Candidatus Dormibacteraeota bacterium]|nr:NEW3 domain-containing protein [Candidatus Dormibacteraeota bacterium]
MLSIALALWVLPLGASSALAADGLALTTPFPDITVSPGTQASFTISVKTTTPERVALALTGAPANWNAGLHGGGFVVNAVETNGKDSTDVRLDVNIPTDASGTTNMTVTATTAGGSVTLPLSVKVEANAGGTVTVTPDYTQLKGAANSSFTFNLTIANQKPQDLTYTATGEGPAGWTVNVTLTGQSQAVSGTVKANSNSNVAVQVTPAANAQAGPFNIAVVATVGGTQFPVPLEVDITGSYSLVLSTPTQLLSGHGPSGNVTDQSFTVTNTGTAPITAVAMSVTPPTNWKVTFDPATIDTLQPNVPSTVIAHITPSGDAIAGDYSLSFSARGKEANASADFRFTVETSLVGGIIGAVLIVAAVGGLLWVFRRYGRR